ncbi:TPA: hypothetical protein QDZ60_003397 [Stenotrophomonas maltophilia]|nr:hypothetical protein [Stenotrophomonas maltophilia]
MTCIRSLTPDRYHALLAVVLAGLLANTAAQACTSAHAGSLTTIRIDAWDDTAADVIVSLWTHTGNANCLRGCSNTQVIPITASASIPVLEFVRGVNVDGAPYPAFGLR